MGSLGLNEEDAVGAGDCQRLRQALCLLLAWDDGPGVQGPCSQGNLREECGSREQVGSAVCRLAPWPLSGVLPGPMLMISEVQIMLRDFEISRETRRDRGVTQDHRFL